MSLLDWCCKQRKQSSRSSSGDKKRCTVHTNASQQSNKGGTNNGKWLDPMKYAIIVRRRGGNGTERSPDIVSRAIAKKSNPDMYVIAANHGVALSYRTVVTYV